MAAMACVLYQISKFFVIPSVTNHAQLNRLCIPPDRIKQGIFFEAIQDPQYRESLIPQLPITNQKPSQLLMR